MKKANDRDAAPEMLDEYDFSQGVRGKYAAQYRAGTNVVVLAPDVADIFPDSESVNEALRVLAKLIRQQAQKHAASGDYCHDDKMDKDRSVS